MVKQLVPWEHIVLPDKLLGQTGCYEIYDGSYGRPKLLGCPLAPCLVDLKQWSSHPAEGSLRKPYSGKVDNFKTPVQ